MEKTQDIESIVLWLHAGEIQTTTTWRLEIKSYSICGFISSLSDLLPAWLPSVNQGVAVLIVNAERRKLETCTTQKLNHLNFNKWKHFGFHVIDGKIMNK